MREYKITKNNIWYYITKENSEEKRYLSHNNIWKSNKSYARVFYHEDEAISNLALMKYKDGKKSD